MKRDVPVASKLDLQLGGPGLSLSFDVIDLYVTSLVPTHRFPQQIELWLVWL